jgi:lactoylglutathione lyase
MKFGYTILYVDDVEKTVSFYESAFGLNRGTVVPDEFGELATGATKLSFAARVHVAKLFNIPLQEAGRDKAAPPVEIALVTSDVDAAFKKALGAGAIEVATPSKKPWGQIVAYVRDNNGFLIEICTPVE